MRRLLAFFFLASCHHAPEPAHGAAPDEEHYGSSIEDDEAWRIAHPERCGSPVRPSDCVGVREYLADFPKGKHAGEARKLLDGLEAALSKVPDDERWSAADVETCKTLDDLGACDDVAAYLAKFPMGKHAAEARALLDAAKPKIDERRKALETAGVDIEILGTDHTGKDCPPLLDALDHHALCMVFDVRVRRPIKTKSLGVMTDCGATDGTKKLHWATGADLTKAPIGTTVDLHLAVPRTKRCTVEVGIGNVPTLEVPALRRYCLHAADDPKDDRAEAGSCPKG
jgi:hypothetical protein